MTVDAQVTSEQLNELMEDGSDVLTTVLDFGNAQIKRASKADLTLLTISGVYTHALGKQIEKIALQCRGNLGMEFREMQPNPAARRKFDSSIVGVLKNVRDRYAKRHQVLLLCMPPTELIDLLKLTGVYDGYHIVEQPGTLNSPTASPEPRHPSRLSRSERLPSGPEEEAIRKKIVHLNQSLKRTVSLEKGLDSAEKCVKRFLPQTPPEVAGYEFAFSYDSSEKVGGDFFDFIPLDDEHLGISIGDVAGHGIDAALLMGISKKVIRIRALDAGPDASTAGVLTRSNADLVTDFTRSTFVTVLYGILHQPSGRFTYARAGHEPPIVCGPERGVAVLHESKGLPLGVDSGRIFDRVLEEKSLELASGAFLLLCTDGIAECWNPRGATYSRKRLIYTLEQLHCGTPCREALGVLLKSLRDFAQGRPQEDDMTTILVKRLVD